MGVRKSWTCATWLRISQTLPELRRVSPNHISISIRIADASLLRSLRALRSAMKTNLEYNAIANFKVKQTDLFLHHKLDVNLTGIATSFSSFMLGARNCNMHPVYGVVKSFHKTHSELTFVTELSALAFIQLTELSTGSIKFTLRPWNCFVLMMSQFHETVWGFTLVTADWLLIFISTGEPFLLKIYVI